MNKQLNRIRTGKNKTPKKSNTSINYLFVEGQTESKLLKEFKHTLKIKEVKIDILNPFTGKGFKKYMMKNPKNIDKIFLIIDSDMLDIDYASHIKKFRENVLNLNPKKLYIMIQYKNLEDELVKALNLSSKNSLYRLFLAEGSKEFKSNFINCRNLSVTLSNLSFELLYNKHTMVEKNILKDLCSYCDSEIYTGNDLFIL